MTVKDLIKQLIELPPEAEIGIAVSHDKICRMADVGVICEEPFGILKPNLAYIEFYPQEEL